MQKIQSFEFVSVNHTRKTVTLVLTHIYNPQCKGCRENLVEAKQIAKDYGYTFILKEPKEDLPFLRSDFNER